MADLKRLLRYMGPYRKDMVIGALLIVVETAFELFIPLLMADRARGSGKPRTNGCRTMPFPIWTTLKPLPWSPE